MATLIEAPEAANRLARAIASDLSLYNEAKIKEGIENDTFFHPDRRDRRGTRALREPGRQEARRQHELLRSGLDRRDPGAQGAHQVEDLVSPRGRPSGKQRARP